MGGSRRQVWNDPLPHKIHQVWNDPLFHETQTAVGRTQRATVCAKDARPLDSSEQLKATVVPAQLRAPVQASPTAPEKPSLPFSQFTFTILGEILRCAVLHYSSGRVEGRHRPVNQLIAVSREAAKTDNILTVCGDLTLTTSRLHPAHPRGPPLPPGALRLPQNFPFSPSPPLSTAQEMLSKQLTSFFPKLFAYKSPQLQDGRVCLHLALLQVAETSRPGTWSFSDQHVTQKNVGR